MITAEEAAELSEQARRRADALWERARQKAESEMLGRMEAIRETAAYKAMEADVLALMGRAINKGKDHVMVNLDCSLRSQIHALLLALQQERFRVTAIEVNDGTVMDVTIEWGPDETTSQRPGSARQRRR